MIIRPRKALITTKSLSVPSELLDTSKASAAICTDSPRFAVHDSAANVVGALGNYMPSGSVGLRPGCVSLYSVHENLGGTHPVGWPLYRCFVSLKFNGCQKRRRCRIYDRSISHRGDRCLHVPPCSQKRARQQVGLRP